MLTKEIIVDKIEVVETGHIQVRTVTRVLDDGAIMPGTESYHRHTLSPGDDLTGQDRRVVAVAQSVWTPEVVAAFEAAQEDAA